MHLRYTFSSRQSYLWLYLPWKPIWSSILGNCKRPCQSVTLIKICKETFYIQVRFVDMVTIALQLSILAHMNLSHSYQKITYSEDKALRRKMSWAGLIHVFHITALKKLNLLTGHASRCLCNYSIQ